MIRRLSAPRPTFRCGWKGRARKGVELGVWIVLLISVVAGFPDFAYGHGVMGVLEAEGGIGVRALYDTGEPMSYAKVTVSAPESRYTFQSGRTDRNGRFRFAPDQEGVWRIVVDDEMGHRLEMEVPVGEDLLPGRYRSEGQAGGSSLGRYERALMGLSIIFGLFGVAAWWTRRKKR